MTIPCPLQDTEFNFTRVKYSCCSSAKHKPSNFIYSHLIHARVVASYPLIGCCCTIPSIRRPSPQRLDINHHTTSNAQHRSHAACHDFMYNKQRRCATTSTITPSFLCSITLPQSLPSSPCGSPTLIGRPSSQSPDPSRWPSAVDR